jgi:hypothetical protein
MRKEKKYLICVENWNRTKWRVVGSSRFSWLAWLRSELWFDLREDDFWFTFVAVRKGVDL